MFMSHFRLIIQCIDVVFLLLSQAISLYSGKPHVYQFSSQIHSRYYA